MSTVSMQNESLPSFEPIEQNTTQKRKRTSTTVKEDDTSPAVKKSRAKKSSRNHTTQPVTIRKSIVWIGASLSQDDGSSGAFSVYYGINDTRNYTEKVTIKESQGLDYVYTMGVICALDTFKNDTTALVIYTGRKIPETFEQDTSCDIEIYNELRQKIEKRKGSTFINCKEDESQEEYKNAHNLSVEKLLEDNMAIDKVAECLQITETKTEVLVLTSRVETTECEKVEVETTVEEVACSSSAAVVVEPASWASTLRLRNLLDVLKAPFSRKNKQK